MNPYAYHPSNPYSGYSGYDAPPPSGSPKLIIAIIIIILLVVIGSVAAYFFLQKPQRSPTYVDPDTGLTIVVHEDSTTGDVVEVRTATDPATGEGLYNCRCDAPIGRTCSDGSPRLTTATNIPESVMLSDYQPCAPSNSGWFCTTTVASSDYCKINNQDHQIYSKSGIPI